MPTGTGKTETMLSILVSMNCEKLLVIVPTDALRTQLAEKFLTLGVLKPPGCAVLKEAQKLPSCARSSTSLLRRTRWTASSRARK